MLRVTAGSGAELEVWETLCSCSHRQVTELRYYRCQKGDGNVCPLSQTNSLLSLWKSLRDRCIMMASCMLTRRANMP